MPDPKRNMGASVRARLLNLAKEHGQPNDLLLTRYALERLLYRLSITRHRERFVLKWRDADDDLVRRPISAHARS